MHVDETGRHVEPGGVDRSFRAAADFADRGDALSLDRQIGDDARRPGPVEDGAALDDQVVVRRPAAEEARGEDEPRKGKAPGCAVPESHRRLSREWDPVSARWAIRGIKVSDDVRNQHRGPPGFPGRNLTKLVIAVVAPSLLLALSIPLIRGSRTRSRKLPVV